MNSRFAPLTGQVAVVTGGARGIGRAYAHRLARLGAKVAVMDRSLRSYLEFSAEAKDMRGDDTADEIRNEGGEAIGIEVDVTDASAMSSAINEVSGRWGRIDVGVCNAGGGTGPTMTAPAHLIEPEVMRTVMDRNFYGTVYTCRPLARVMTNQGAGKIITVSSIAGITVANDDGSYADYGTAKAAIATYTRYLAKALGPSGVTVNCVAPGHVATGRLSENFREMGEDKIIQSIPLRRIGTVEDCANIIEFLATSLSDFVTGQVISVDGGTSLFAH